MPQASAEAHATIDQVAPGGRVNLSDAPAALDDSTFDSLFPAEPAPIASTQTQEPAPASTVQTAPSHSTTTEPFIKGAKSVYNTPEAAVEGINQKDALIEQLRQRYALTTGIDPITGQPIQPVAQPQPQGTDYNQSPDTYIRDLSAAYEKGGPRAYADVQQKFLFDTLKPLQPILQRAAREQAVEAVSQEIKEVGGFIGTAQYDQTLDSVPELRDAIKTAEADYRFHSRLPGLYKIAYLAGQGRQLPEILQAQAAQQTKTNPSNPPRTSMTPTTYAPQYQTNAAKPSFKTLDGIKSIIADAEARGAKLDF